MRVAIPGNRRRAIFLARDEQRIHLPISQAPERLFLLDGAGRTAALAQAAASGADATLVLDPLAVTPDELSRLPGLKLGVVTGPVSLAELAALRARARQATNPGGYAAYTWPASERPQAAHDQPGLPILLTLPLPLDLERLPAAPRPHGERLLVPAWAKPPEPLLERLRARAAIEELPANANLDSTLAALARSATLLYCSADALAANLGERDRLPWLALGCGLLLITNKAFAPSLGLEQEDEYLLRATEDEFAREALRSLAEPACAQPVRVRAWQKIREAFAAGPAFDRLLHDALWAEGLLG